MKIFLTALSWFILLLGIIFAATIIFMSGSVIMDGFKVHSSPMILLMMLPFFILAICAISYGYKYLKLKNTSNAVGISNIIGFVVWLSVNTVTMKIYDPSNRDPNIIFMAGIILIPIILGVMTTKLFNTQIRKAFESESEQAAPRNR